MTPLERELWRRHLEQLTPRPWPAWYRWLLWIVVGVAVVSWIALVVRWTALVVR